MKSPFCLLSIWGDSAMKFAVKKFNKSVLAYAKDSQSTEVITYIQHIIKKDNIRKTKQQEKTKELLLTK